MDTEDAAKSELIRQITSSRGEISSDLAGIAYECNLVGRAKRSFRARSGTWVVGAAVTGLALALAIRGGRSTSASHFRSEKRPAEKLASLGLLLPALKLLLPVLKPVLSHCAERFFARKDASPSEKTPPSS